MTNRTFKTGESRDQASLLPARIEDYVGADNPVREIESLVCALDLAKIGFRHADRRSEEAGQPPYDPADLLKLYLCGYTNQVRSSRQLEQEACCMLPAAPWKHGDAAMAASFRGEIWLLGGESDPRLLDEDNGNQIWSSSHGKTWTYRSKASWSARAGAALLAFNDQLWLFGGHSVRPTANEIRSSSDGVAWALENNNRPPSAQRLQSAPCGCGLRIQRQDLVSRWL
jgi:Transposase domain (DUF772)